MSDAKNQKNTPNSHAKNDNESNGYAQSNSTPTGAKRIGWHRNVIKFLRKVGIALRSFFEIIGELWEEVMKSITFLFNVIVKRATSPITPIFFAIVLVLFVTILTLDQWWKIGVWIARLVNFNRSFGGFGGILFGLGINAFQLSPTLWKIRRDLTDAYKDMGVNTEYEAEAEETPQTLDRNWFSVNHRALKVLSAASYCVETALVIAYVGIVQKLAMKALFQALISLRGPEETLKLASHTISILGTASRRAAYRQPPECDVDF
jgi:hypothetical protein